MRWTRYALIGLLLLFVVWCWWFVSSFNSLNEAVITGPGAWGMALLLCTIYLVVIIDQKTKKAITHGSAHHAMGKEADKYRIPRAWPPLEWLSQRIQSIGEVTTSVRTALFYALITLTRGQPVHTGHHRLVLGSYQMQEISLGESRQYQHLLLTAPTGAGKSTRLFLPNLLRETGARSLFIGDLKNELYQKTAGWLAQYMQIWLFSPLRDAGQCYNPLAHIKSVEDAQSFAEAWVANTGSSHDEFWANNAKLLITAMTLHLLASEEAPAFSRLADLLTASFEDIREKLDKTQSPDARRLAHQFLANMATNERLVGSVMTDLGVRFQLLASPQVRAATATNDLDFAEMIEIPTAFFLTIPRSESRRYRPLLAVLTMQMFTAWEKSGTNGMGCYLDEFTNLGHIPGFAEFISTARSLKVSLFMAIQNFSQLNERYGREDADTIKANAVTHLLLPGAGLEECRYYSERIGDRTIATSTTNRRSSGMGAEVSSSEGETRRRLMTPDELRTMPPDQMLVLEAASAPLVIKTTPYFLDRQLASRADLPYRITRVREEAMETSPSPQPRGLLPAASGQKPRTSSEQQEAPIVVEAEDDKIFFPPE